MNNAEITRAFLEAGWEIRYRGGNEICSTPSDLEMIVADAPVAAGAPGPPGSRPRYSIAAWPTADGPDGEARPHVFLDLYDAEEDTGTRVTYVPTPEQAVQILAQLVNGKHRGQA